MLTVRNPSVEVGDVRAALAQAEYLLAEADSPIAFRGDYAGRVGACLSDGTPSAVWLGSEAALRLVGVGLGKEVKVEELALALQGLSLAGEQIRKPGRGRVHSVELHMAVPKSVSWVWAVADPQVRAAIERIWLRAAEATVGYLLGTRDVLFVGRDETGRKVYAPAEGFVAVGAMHVTSRVAAGEVIPAPQLHFHFYVLGGERQGKLFTPATEELFGGGAPVEGGGLFRSLGAQGMVGLGLPVRAGTGSKGRFFEIEGVSEELIEDGSGRARQIARERGEVEAEKGRQLSNREAAGLALIDRRGKDRSLSPEIVNEGWREIAEGRGLTLKRVQEWRRQRELGPLENRLERARALALERFRERGPTVTLGEANAIVYEAGVGSLSIREANGLLEAMQRSGEVIALEGGLVTTRAIREQEQQIIDAVLRAATKRGRAVSLQARENGIRRASEALGFELDPEQAEAARQLCSGLGVGVLHGRAGTGKSPVLRAIAEGRRADGWTVLAGAPDGKTRDLMAKDIRVPAFTLASLIPIVERDGLGPRTQLIIDECGKVSQDDWARIVSWLDRYQIELTLSGHTGQHDAILLPGMFAEIVRQRDPETARGDVRVTVKELTEIRRHSLEWHKKLQISVDMGQGEKVVELLREHDAIAISDTAEEAIERTVDRWDQARRRHEDLKAAIMVISGSNVDVDRVNELAQERRRRNNELSRVSVRAVDRDYRLCEGDLVVLAAAPYAFKATGRGAKPAQQVANGTMGIVESVDPEHDTVHVRLSEPSGEHRSVTIDQRELRDRAKRGATTWRKVPALRLAYAHHTFPIQGATVQEVFYCLITMPGKKGFYVGITRQRGRLHLEVNRGTRGRPTDDDKVYEKLASKIGKSDTPVLGISRRPISASVARRLPKVARSPYEQTQRAPGESMAKPAVREPVTILAQLTAAFGPGRAKQLAENATRHARQVAGLEENALLRAINEGRRALEQLDPRLARESWRNQDRQGLLRERIQYALGQAEMFEAQASHHRRGRRKQLSQAAATHRESAARHHEQLAQLAEQRRLIRQNPNDPDSWLERYQPQIEFTIAAQREQLMRQEQQRESQRQSEYEQARQTPEAGSPELVA